MRIFCSVNQKTYLTSPYVFHQLSRAYPSQKHSIHQLLFSSSINKNTCQVFTSANSKEIREQQFWPTKGTFFFFFRRCRRETGTNPTLVSGWGVLCAYLSHRSSRRSPNDALIRSAALRRPRTPRRRTWRISIFTQLNRYTIRSTRHSRRYPDCDSRGYRGPGTGDQGPLLGATDSSRSTPTAD